MPRRQEGRGAVCNLSSRVRRWDTVTRFLAPGNLPEANPFCCWWGSSLRERDHKRCAQQLVEAAVAENCAVSAVQATHESKLPYYGRWEGILWQGGADCMKFPRF